MIYCILRDFLEPVTLQVRQLHVLAQREFDDWLKLSFARVLRRMNFQQHLGRIGMTLYNVPRLALNTYQNPIPVRQCFQFSSSLIDVDLSSAYARL